LAGVSNTIGGKAPMLERSVFAAGIPLEECERIHQLARERLLITADCGGSNGYRSEPPRILRRLLRLRMEPR